MECSTPEWRWYNNRLEESVGKYRGSHQTDESDSKKGDPVSIIKKEWSRSAFPINNISESDNNARFKIILKVDLFARCEISEDAH